MSVETERSSTESEVSGLDYEETALTLRLPGGTSRVAGSEPDRKRGFSETVELGLGSGAPVGTRGVGSTDDQSDESPESQASVAEKPPAPKARVVGWPPVRSFRKNVMKSCKLVKVAVDGAPYLRKVDLEAYTGYHQLLTALQEMFSCFTLRNYPDEERKLVDPVNGTEYVPTYEDKEGDWMLVGDVPWKMFVESCKRVRLMKSSEAVNLAPRAQHS
ncbi:Auxin-responsive protein [Rhynchospora pubera]|uniref:Auxin-responsive protein n=1 Tax=Rhynchospora pubera TaxID=906938 RepID=A0AAV8EVH3_9POAL|nr:Auxin-responsive protein [Rhynchospora pubera]